MLSELRVIDYAIIDNIHLTFVPGLNILTGETGAGKSIVVGALSFVLGERVTDDIVRKGSDVCRVEAVFNLDKDGLNHRLGESTVADRGGQLTVSRELRRGGRSKCMVNGEALSLTALRDLGILLVDFHGQHDHQLLLHAASHIDFLDGFGGLLDLRSEFDAKRRAFVEIGAKIAAIQQEIADIKSKGDLMRYEMAEIEQAGLKEQEDDQVESEIRLLEHAEKIIDAGTHAMDAVYDSEDAAIKLISRASNTLDKIAPYSEDLASLGQELEQAEVIVKEVAQSLRDYLSRIDLDSSRLENLRERRAIVERLKRKYGRTVRDVLDHLKRLKDGMENTAQLEAEVEDLLVERNGLQRDLVALAGNLSKKRGRAARRLERLAETELRSLGLEGSSFKVGFEDIDQGDRIEAENGRHVTISEKGADFAEFFLRTNRGEDLMQLRRIASGGEISRVMLALKKILAEVDQVGSLVFDEIDAGIGGSIADVVAAKLHEVARSRQVMCITHLPQIAALADLHLAVGKMSVGGRTVTNVVEVLGDDRVKEVARMIDGRKPTRSARIHAEEILKRAVVK